MASANLPFPLQPPKCLRAGEPWVYTRKQRLEAAFLWEKLGLSSQQLAHSTMEAATFGAVGLQCLVSEVWQK